MYAIYLRKSREDERNFSDEDTLDKHERILVDFAKRNNYPVAKFYKEVVTGGNLSKRKAMLELLDDLYTKKYEGVIAVDLARISRGDLADSKIIYDCFKETKTKIITLLNIYYFGSDYSFDDFNQNSSTEQVFIESFFNHLELMSIVGRFTRGRHQAQREGFFIGTNVSFGYQKVKQNKGYILVPDQNAKWVQEIFDKYVNEDYSVSQIRDWLNTLDLTSSSYKVAKWDNSRVYRILTNVTYLGYIRAQTYTVGQTKLFKGRHQAIISQELFDKAQIILKEKQAPQLFDLDRRINNPFNQIIYCSSCNSLMVVSEGVNHLNKVNRLVCSNNSCLNIPAFLDEVVEAFIKCIKNKIEELTKDLLENNQVSFYFNKDKSNLSNLRALEILVDKCNHNYKKGLYSKDIYLIRLTKLNEQINYLKNNNIEEIEEVDRKKEINFYYYILERFNKIKSKRERSIFLKKYIDKIIYQRNDKDISLDILFKKEEILKWKK